MNASQAELKFAELWLVLYPEIDLHSEYQFCPPRRFRLDFANIPSRVGVEINGGNWAGGRHTRAGDLDNQYVKHNLGILNGWVIFTLSPAMIDEYWLRAIATTIQSIENL